MSVVMYFWICLTRDALKSFFTKQKHELSCCGFLETSLEEKFDILLLYFPQIFLWHGRIAPVHHCEQISI